MSDLYGKKCIFGPPHLRIFDANASREGFVEEECVDLISWILRHPSFDEKIGERPGQFIQLLRVDTKKIKSVLLGIDSDKFKDPPHTFGQPGRDGASEGSAQKDHSADVPDDSLCTGVIAALLTMDEELGCYKSPKAVCDDDDRSVLLESQAINITDRSRVKAHGNFTYSFWRP